MVNDHGNEPKYTLIKPEPFYNGPGHPKKATIHDGVEETLASKGNVDALKLIALAVASDFDQAESAEARSTLARTLSALTNSIRLAEGTKITKEDDQEDLLDTLRKKRAEGA